MPPQHVFSLLLLLFFVGGLEGAGPRPEQVHLAFHGNSSVMNVAWITWQADASTVYYGSSPSNMPYSNTGSNKAWTYNGITRYSHRALMSGLTPNSRVYYRINDRTFSFKTLPENPKNYKVCIFGDLGYFHGNSTASIIKNGLAGNFDFIIHVGDISYDLHTNDGKNGDNYMNQLEPLISTMPYMVIAGNHEDDGKNFSHYQNRFWMPHNGYHDNQFYSFDLGPIHWVGVSTENYGSYNLYGMGPVLTQFNWLKNDLQAANSNRKNVPWIISYQHRPFYCSNDNSAECKSFENRLVRTGWLDMPGLEPLYTLTGMDMGFWGHEHSYERNWPIADRKYYAGNQYLHNAPAPVYVLTGSAGCHTPNAGFGPAWPWSAVRNKDDFGYTILDVVNATHLHVQQISIQKNDQPVDDFWLSKDLTHVHSDEMRSSIPSRSMPPVNCPSSHRACRMTLEELNEEL